MKTEIKYAPKSLSEVIFPNVATERRIMGYASGALEGHIMLHGTNGTGKTTIAKLLPIAIAGKDAHVEDRDYDEILGQKDIKGYLRRTCQFDSLTSSGKYFLVFNEFDNAKINLNKLWTAMDACEDALMVIITTNKPMLVHESIRSRCRLIEMPAHKAEAILPRAMDILKIEGVSIPASQVLQQLKAQEIYGDLRKYMGAIDEMLYAATLGLTFPTASPLAAPAFTVLSNS